MAGALSGFKLKSPGMEAMLKGAAGRSAVEGPLNAVLSAAKSNAPVDEGTYRDELHIEWTTTDRIVGRVVSSVDYGMVIEADTGNLARALDAAG